jgi:hypothetical protein
VKDVDDVAVFSGTNCGDISSIDVRGTSSTGVGVSVQSMTSPGLIFEAGLGYFSFFAGAPPGTKTS